MSERAETLPIATAIGVTVYNEEQNLDALLREAVAATGPHLEVQQIVVVSSGSTDRSVEIARAWAARDPRVEVAIDPVRRGKATAVNQFLARLRPSIRVCVLSGGDMRPQPGCFDALVAPFVDPSVGMTGAHPVPTNPGSGWVDDVVRVQWALHHELALDRPKMGELVAFRADVPALDPETVVDEAWLETIAIGRGQRLVYVPDAVVWNQGPSVLAELLDQRRRVFCGHLWLRGTRHYAVATFWPRPLLSLALRHARARPEDTGALLVAGAAELVGRGLGTLDYLRGRKPFVWSAVPTSKAEILAPRESRDRAR
ncbi:MAG: glycosyltransferase [Sandaracinaceae bacterium]|nr:glycosyltransferase [Sandaracinaceae bacterium]